MYSPATSIAPIGGTVKAVFLFVADIAIPPSAICEIRLTTINRHNHILMSKGKFVKLYLILSEVYKSLKEYNILILNTYFPMRRQ
jgi:hypothetical protein